MKKKVVLCLLWPIKEGPRVLKPSTLKKTFEDA